MRVYFRIDEALLIIEWKDMATQCMSHGIWLLMIVAAFWKTFRQSSSSTSNYHFLISRRLASIWIISKLSATITFWHLPKLMLFLPHIALLPGSIWDWYQALVLFYISFHFDDIIPHYYFESWDTFSYLPPALSPCLSDICFCLILIDII